ncbi:hypothetical protein TRFO_16084 [Tritrichomonas foetus]|uniref:RCC1-like domain-containing protein n=1 Tax=Tritrichomonas foetus TaxID=1144522 RepID=A0A1J4KS96_9EUKA|nr:hypothetical protein TRFO_16084 [Tritrichomonas foetus]|eukprot:OHT13752.1 hypothetical protein TRFO_16084 [Tritrichomonas foetus]
MSCSDKCIYIVGCGTNVNNCLGPNNESNELGFYLIDVPAEVKGIKKLLCGTTYSAFIDNEGRYYQWGQLSQNHHLYKYPSQLKYFEENKIKIKTASCMNQHVAVLTSNYQIYVWGNNTFGHLPGSNNISDSNPMLINIPNSSKPISVACGGYFTLILLENGEVYSFGLNNENSLGIENQARVVKTPTKIFQLRNIIQIAAGWSHSCALSKNQTVFSWGRSSFGRLGHLRDDHISQVDIGEVKKIACSHTSTFAVKENNRIYACGWNQSGENGVGDKKCHRQMKELMNVEFEVKAIAGGAESCLFLDKNGKVYASGSNNNNVMGIGSMIKESLAPFHICSLKATLLIATGTKHSLFVIEV